MLDGSSQDWFEQQRQRHFPAGRNLIPAHVTLFHHLPGAQQASIEQILAECCQSLALAPFSTTGVRFLGRGSAYTLAMPEIAALRQRLSIVWATWLTAQDQQGWRPHVTVQNKVDAGDARHLHHALSTDFAPRVGLVTGLVLWRYLGGPWESLRKYRFASIA